MLDEELLARLRQCFKLMMKHQFESVTFKLPSARWLSARGKVVGVMTTVEVCCNGNDRWVQFTGAACSTEFSPQSKWAYPCATWFLPVAPDQLNTEGLSDMADSNRCLLEELDALEIQDVGRLHANFLSAVSYDFLYALVATGPAVNGYVRVLDDQALPVIGSPGDILRLQGMLDELDRMHSHCLDLNDLISLFQDRDGAWQRLRVTAVLPGGALSAAMAEIQREQPHTSAWWFLFRSIESAKRIHLAVQALLPNNERVLMIPVQSDSHGGARCENEIILLTMGAVNGRLPRR